MENTDREIHFRQHLMLYINSRYSSLPNPDAIVDQIMIHFRASQVEAEQRAVAKAWTIPLFG